MVVAEFTPCPSCGTFVDPRHAQACGSCGWAFQIVEIKNTLSNFQSPKSQAEVNLGTCIDKTGSSGGFARGIPYSCELIYGEVDKKAAHVTHFVQTHGDEDYGEHPLLITNGESSEQAIEDIREITYAGGGDAEETHLSAIEDALRGIPWAHNPRKARDAMIVFLTADTKPARSGKTPTELGHAIREAGILFYLICQPTKKLRELVSAADGLMFEISNDPSPQDMQQVAATVSASIAHTVATGGTVPASHVGPLGIPHIREDQ